MYIPTAIVFATADGLASHLQKKGSHCGRVSEMRFGSLKSSRDSSRQYSLKMMYPRQLFLGRVSIATGIRDSTTHKNKRATAHLGMPESRATSIPVLNLYYN